MSNIRRIVFFVVGFGIFISGCLVLAWMDNDRSLALVIQELTRTYQAFVGGLPWLLGTVLVVVGIILLVLSISSDDGSDYELY